MDPQQRLMLEVCWEACENAVMPVSSSEPSPVGIFMGICTQDYACLQAKYDDSAKDLGYFATGSFFSAAVGRLSYTFGFQGPCIAVDTACSSSLVSVHLACQALRSGECPVALAGGVNSIANPETSVNFSKAGMLSHDGRCKTFDQSANGYVRGEGCGVLVLKLRSDALANNDRILAVIRGSAVNQDGRSSSLTAPNGPSQENVIRTALAVAGVEPEQVSYVEAHGTGTPLGDPIEINVIASVFGPRSKDAPLYVGYVKTETSVTWRPRRASRA